MAVAEVAVTLTLESLSTDVFIPRTATRRQLLLLLAHSLNYSNSWKALVLAFVNWCFWTKSREHVPKIRLPVAVCYSTSVLKLLVDYNNNTTT